MGCINEIRNYVEPTKLNSFVTGGNTGGPVAITSVNTQPTSTKGIIE